MIESIQIRNFQSLQNIELDLAPFTVIVGRSSSGKSAFVRALSTLFSNRRGTDFISHGTTTSVVTATVPQGLVSLSRSLTAAKNMYTIAPAGGEPQPFTKLGGDVPPEVSEFIRVVPKDNVVLAQQFDKPFLLAESPQQAAQILGSLTNVHVIFEAAREANRRRLSANQTLKTKLDDLESIEGKLKAFEDLEGKQARVEQAKAALAAGEAAERRLAALNAHIAALRDTKAAITSAQARVSRVVPSVDEVEEAQSRLVKFNLAVEELRASNRDAASAKERLATAELNLAAYEKKWTEALAELGTCPTCGQPVG